MASYVYNSRVSASGLVVFFQMHSNKQNLWSCINVGDIGAGVGFKDIRTGDTLCDENAPITLGEYGLPRPSDQHRCGAEDSEGYG